MNQLSGRFEVQLGKKKHKCHLSMNAFRLLCESEEISFKDMQKWMQKDEMRAICVVVYWGLVNNVYFTAGNIDDLPNQEYVAAHLLEDFDALATYGKHISQAMEGEPNKPGKAKKGGKK